MKTRLLIIIGLAVLVIGLVAFGVFKSWSEESKSEKSGKLSSVLYELTLASNREDFAKKHDIPIFEEKIKVFIIFNPNSSSSEREELMSKYAIIEKKGIDNILSALVSIDSIYPLSKEEIIQFIKLPDTPVPAGGMRYIPRKEY